MRNSVPGEGVGDGAVGSFEGEFQRFMGTGRDESVELLRPGSLFLDDYAESVWFEVAVGSYCERVPLQLGDDRHIYEDVAEGTILET